MECQTSVLCRFVTSLNELGYSPIKSYFPLKTLSLSCIHLLILPSGWKANGFLQSISPGLLTYVLIIGITMWPHHVSLSGWSFPLLLPPCWSCNEVNYSLYVQTWKILNIGIPEELTEKMPKKQIENHEKVQKGSKKLFNVEMNHTPPPKKSYWKPKNPFQKLITRNHENLQK